MRKIGGFFILKSEPKPKVVQIPFKVLGLSTGQIVFVRTTKNS